MAGYAGAIAAFQLSLLTSPLAIVIVVSLIVGLLMVVLFGYTSDQKAIGIAKDQLKAHLLAVRLYRDQIPVVMGSYGKILRGTGRYLKLAFKPLLYVIIPITLLIVQIDRYLGAMPIPPNVPFPLPVRGRRRPAGWEGTCREFRLSACVDISGSVCSRRQSRRCRRIVRSSPF